MWNPLLPAIVFAWWVFRIWTGTVTWLPVAGIVVSLLWLALAILVQRAGAESLEELLADKSTPPEGTTTAPPVRGTPEYDAYMRQAVARIREIQRINALPPPPPPTADEIRATAQPAICLRQATFPVPLDQPGRSYIGGLPRLPPEIPWPESATHEVFGLTFLAQIDLAELPQIESSPLPRSGTLYFFEDTSGDGSEPSDSRVLYYAGDTADVPFRDLPKNARGYIGYGRGDPWPWLAEESVWARTSFRFPLEPAKVTSYRDSGPRHPPPPNPWEIFKEDREEWPFAWTVIDHGARAIVHAVREVTRWREPTEAAPVYERIGSAASKWVERAATEAPHARPDDETRAAFRSEWRALVDEFQATSQRLKTYGPNPGNDLLDIVVASCYVCASNDALDVVPEMYRNGLEQVSAARLHSPMHQMLGHGERVQSAPIDHADDILLLQLVGDPAIGWHSNIGCVMQFWISPEALEQRAFDGVVMTLDCD